MTPGGWRTTVYRLEFLQPDGRWTGPYCAEWMTLAGIEIRDQMILDHCESPQHPEPDPTIFTRNPGRNRYVCGSPTMAALVRWFGPYFDPLMREGAHLGTYLVPDTAIAARDVVQVVYQQRRAALRGRIGIRMPAPSELVERLHPTKALQAATAPAREPSVAQRTERPASNRTVAGSNPARGTYQDSKLGASLFAEKETPDRPDR